MLASARPWSGRWSAAGPSHEDTGGREPAAVGVMPLILLIVAGGAVARVEAAYSLQRIAAEGHVAAGDVLRFPVSQ